MRKLLISSSIAIVLTFVTGLLLKTFVFTGEVKRDHPLKHLNENPLPIELSWDDLVKLNYKTGEKTEKLEQADNQLVKVPGFFVPLSDDLMEINEFLLVPNAQACIHVPPPPPNLTVYVKLEKPTDIDSMPNPTWIIGYLRIKETKSIYGKASYQIDATKIEEYQW